MPTLSRPRPDRGASAPTLGFGVPATSDPHHFKVIIPRSNSAPVQVSEYLGLQALSDEHSVIDRVLLDRARWTAIRSEVQRAFNARLSAHGLKPSAWKVGDNPVDRLLGKELCVLAWAVGAHGDGEDPRRRAQLAGAAPGGALVAVRHDGHEHRRHRRRRQGLAPGAAARAG